MEGIVLSNLDQIVKNPEVLRKSQSADHWSTMEYEIDEVKGTCIVAADNAQPADIVFAPKLKGWHKIYVAGWALQGGFAFMLKLDNDPVYSLVNDSTLLGRGQWVRYEWVEEFFWCAADLTDREIILHKRENVQWACPLVWFRCVPMTDEEVAEYKEYMGPGKRNLHLHIDNDGNAKYGIRNLEYALVELNAVKGTDAKFITMETSDDVFDYDAHTEKTRCINQGAKRYEDRMREYAENIDQITKARADLMHSMGVEMYAGLRMSLSSTTTPSAPLVQLAFVNKHPEYFCKTRDGRTVQIASYAYPEVRRYAIDRLKKTVARGYDGVSLIMHRGIHIAFEQPVLDEVARRYNGLDARRLPMDDPRLNGVWCEYITQLIRDLHNELDAEFGRHIPINIITDYDPDTAKRVGVDVETLAKEGLIDRICSDAMEVYERLGGCLDEDGLIDLEKYKAESKKRYMVSRMFGHSPERAYAGTPKYLEIAKKYGVEFFATITPQRHRDQKIYLEWQDKLKELGAENFSMYNFCHIAQDKAITYFVGKFGHDEINMDYCTPRYYRVLSIDGFDISTFPPNWRT